MMVSLLALALTLSLLSGGGCRDDDGSSSFVDDSLGWNQASGWSKTPFLTPSSPLLLEVARRADSLLNLQTRAGGLEESSGCFVSASLGRCFLDQTEVATAHGFGRVTTDGDGWVVGGVGTDGVAETDVAAVVRGCGYSTLKGEKMDSAGEQITQGWDWLLARRDLGEEPGWITGLVAGDGGYCVNFGRGFCSASESSSEEGSVTKERWLCRVGDLDGGLGAVPDGGEMDSAAGNPKSGWTGGGPGRVAGWKGFGCGLGLMGLGLCLDMGCLFWAWTFGSRSKCVYF